MYTTPAPEATVAETTDYGPTIADLERKRDEIDRTIAMLRALSGLPAVETSSRNGTPGGPVAFTNKHFFGMKAPDAILLYLDSVKEARAPTRIASDLVEHGFITTSSTPAEIIRTALRRLEKDGKVVQVKKEWGLPGWYPGLKGRQREGGTETEPRKPSRPAAGKKHPASARKAATKRDEPPKKLNAYQKFMKDQMASGKGMAEAAAAWKAQQGKQG